MDFDGRQVMAKHTINGWPMYRLEYKDGKPLRWRLADRDSRTGRLVFSTPLAFDEWDFPRAVKHLQRV